MDLGDIDKVTIGHDGTGAGAGWFLKKVVIMDPRNEQQSTTFNCNKYVCVCVCVCVRVCVL